MTVSIDVEDAGWNTIPDLESLSREAVQAALSGTGRGHDKRTVTIVFASDAEVAALSRLWRGKDASTNVLSFPAAGDLPVPAGEARPLGDIILASGVVAREAAEQGKSLPQHVTHLIIHATLHLLGYDHAEEGEAAEMERLEVAILKGLGISNPYERD